MPDPTNPFATATSLAIGTTGTHTLNASTAQDDYRFTLSGRSSVNLTLTGLNANVDLQLLGRSGAVLQQSTNTGNTAENVNATDLSAGVYYIRVLGASGTTNAPYTLGLQAQTNAKTDLLWRNYSTGANVLWQMNGTTFVTGATLAAVADPQWQLAGSADFTGDGQADLVWRNQATGQNVVWQMNGTTFVTGVTLAAADSQWQIGSVDDWNGDGQADLIWRNATTGDNRVWQMNGTTVATTVLLPSVTDRNWQLVGSGDFNRDGQTDLVWRNDSTGANVVWQMNGTTLQSGSALTSVTDRNWRLEGVADFNGDTQPDLVWRNYATGEDAIWLLQGTTLLPGGRVSFTPVTDLNWQIAAPLMVYGDPGLADIAGNTPATALNLGTLNGQATYHSTVSSSSSSDYYRFQLTAPDPAVYLRTSTGNLELLDSSGGLIQRVVTAGAPVAIQRALDSGSYYLRVYGTTSYVLGVFDTTAPPSITTRLVNDTARAGIAADNRTADPTVSVQVGTEHGLSRLSAGFNATDPSAFLELGTLLGTTFTLTPTQLQAINGGVALPDGRQVLHLRATGVFNVTTTTTDLTFTLDTTTSVPSGLHLTTGTGTTTNVTTPIVTGQAEVGALVKVYGAGNVLLGQGVADSTGTWQAKLAALADGTYNVTASSTDGAGNVSAASTVLSLTITTSLTAPTNLALTTASDQGVSSTDGITKVAAPVLQGNAKLGATVKVYDAAKVLLGQGTVDGNGNWQAPLSALTDGSYTLQAIASDAAGNVSAAATIKVTIDATAPVVVLDTNTAVVLTQQAHLSGYVADTGSGVVAAQYHFDSLAPVALTLDTYGDFDQAFDWTGISNGAHTLTLTTTDLAGNALTKALAVTVNQNLTAPTLTAALAHDTGWDSTDGVTADPKVTGKLAGGNTTAHLQVGLDGAAATSFTTVAVGSDGTFTLDRALMNTLAGGTLAQGDHTLHLQARDTSGNLLSVADVALTLDTVAPTLTVTTPLNVALVNNAHLAGTVNETGSGLVTLQYQFDGQPTIALGVKDTGSFDDLLDWTGINNGNHTLSISGTDAAGNVSAFTPLNVNVQRDLTQPGLLTAALVQDTGSSATDGITTNATIAGTVTGSQVVQLLATLDNSPNPTFTDVTAQLAQGALTLNLATLFSDMLGDGAQTLRLQALDAQGNVIGVSHVALTLDTAAPDLRVTSLINGITWKAGQEQLHGTVTDASALTTLSYQFDGAGAVQSLTPNALGAFDLQTLLLPSTLGSHTLALQATDAAGNQQALHYKFLIKQGASVLDTDVLDDDTANPPNPPINNGGGSSDGASQFLAGGGASGSNYAYPHGGIGGGAPSADPLGNLTPSTPYVPPTGSGYGMEPLPTYLEKLAIIFDQAVDSITTNGTDQNAHRKAALQQRESLLMAIGDMVDEGQFYNRMAPVFQGIYAEANNQPVVTTSEARGAGTVLAGELAPTNATSQVEAVKVQVYQAALLAVVNHALLDQQYSFTAADQAAYKATAAALLQLGHTYAALNPTAATDTATATAPNWLDSLWRAQQPGANIQAALTTGMAALNMLLAGVADPLRALQFVNNLVQAATNVEALQADLKDAKFIRELVEFGFNYAKLNPIGTVAAGGDAVNAFLDTLWKGGTDQQLRLAQGGLSGLFNELGTEAQRIKLLDFEDKLLQADGLLQGTGLQDQKHDASFIGNLVGLGSSYVALNPSTTGTTVSSTSTPNLFLNTIWQTQNIQEGASQLGDFLNLFDQASQRPQVLNYSRNLLSTLALVPNLQNDLIDPEYLAETFAMIPSEVFTYFDSNSGQDLEGTYLPLIWNAKSFTDLKQAADLMQQQGGYLIINTEGTLIASSNGGGNSIANSRPKYTLQKSPAEYINLIAAMLYGEGTFYSSYLGGIPVGITSNTTELKAIGAVILNRRYHLFQYPQDRQYFGDPERKDNFSQQSIANNIKEIEASPGQFDAYNGNKYNAFLNNQLENSVERDAAQSALNAAYSISTGHGADLLNKTLINPSIRRSYPFFFYYAIEGSAKTPLSQRSPKVPVPRADPKSIEHFGDSYFWNFLPNRVAE